MSFTANTVGRLAVPSLIARHGIVPIATVGLLHFAAIAVMFWCETSLYSMLLFALTWGLLNFFFLAALRRVAISAALSLVILVALVLFSEFKFSVLWIQMSFIDVMVVDVDTAVYLLTIFPWLRWAVPAAGAVVLPLLVLSWWADPLRLRFRYALAGFAICLGGIVGLASLFDLDDIEAYHGNNYVSYFARSGVKSVSELMTHGMLDSDPVTADRLTPVGDMACNPATKPPHIILVHDESSFDIRSAPGIKVPPGYGEHFKSFDGKERNFLVEGVGGPSWYAEYSVMSGLSARSFGRFSYFVLGIASGRVQRGLPNVLRRCGYKTHTLFPALGAFMNSRSFQTNVGIQQFQDESDLGAKGLEPDKFYYDKALSMMQNERGTGAMDPTFFYIYLGANHWPWDWRYHPELMPQWKDLGNQPPLVDEYLRRQAISAEQFTAFKESLKKKFPGEPFLLVRYGDHQPDFSTQILEPKLDRATIVRHVSSFDMKYYTTYYAIDAINFNPVDVSSAVETLDGPYLPLVTLEAAGLPLDPSFVEQKNILKRCGGIFYACRGGAEARRFNRLLIDAGLIKKL